MLRGKVLILDDDLLTGKTVQKVIALSNFDTRLTSNADDFFLLCREWVPDCIVLDLLMPGVDGMQVLLELAQQGCTSGIILTSGVDKRVLDAAMRSARELGLRVLGALGKPFNAAALKQLLEAVAPSGAAVSAPFVSRVGSRSAPSAKSGLTSDELIVALERNELFNVYQPKVDSHSLVLTGFETLVRWQHPQLGVVGPDNFIPLAEQNGLIDRLTLWVLESSLRWFSAQLKADGSFSRLLPQHDHLSLSVNISVRTLGNPDIFERFSELCDHYDILPQHVILELTESSAMRDPAIALAMLTRLRMKGFRLSIDDFGTGYSSMLQLVRLPFSEIKVDKSFVMTATTSNESRVVIKSIIELAHSLGLQVIAEGIEDQGTLDYLRQQGCDQVQGYFIARPLREADVMRWLEQRQPTLEQQRLAALQATHLLDTGQEERFDSLLALAQRLFEVPMGYIALVDSDSLWLKAKIGIDAVRLGREDSICTHTILGDGVMIVEDITADARFKHLPERAGFPDVRFYAGCALEAGDGSRIGTACLLDTMPRKFRSSQAQVLRQFATLVGEHLHLPANAVLDGSTGILNRQGFEVTAGDAMELCAGMGKGSALVLYDLEPVGGRMLQREALAIFASVLRRSLRRSDVLAHLNEDNQFASLLVGAENTRLDSIMQRLGFALQQCRHERAVLADIVVNIRTAYASPGETESLQSCYNRAEMGRLTALA